MRYRLPVIFAILILVLLAGWAIRTTSSPGRTSSVVLQSHPRGVMGTVCNLVLVTDVDQADIAGAALEAAEAELRRQEALLSTWIDASQVSRLNAAPAGQELHLASEVAEVLSLARDLHTVTAGTFDITARPLIELWRISGQRGLIPTPESLEAARAESSWGQIHLTAGAVSKVLSSTRVDVDGIAKGYAIDRAVEVLRESGAPGGMVEVGGDLRLYGRGPEGENWTVAIRSPFEDLAWAKIEVQDGAVCSSGDYARFLEIEGRRFSHIIDPRSGWPTEETHAVTVVGPDAATADAWATALSILGDAGLDLLDAEDGMEAMLVIGESDNYEVRMTTGFRQMIIQATFDLSE